MKRFPGNEVTLDNDERRQRQRALKEQADEDSLMCSLDAPVYQHLRLDAVNRFRGMVLDGRGRIVRRLLVSIDGKAVGEFTSDRPSEDLAQYMPHLPAARNCRFELDLFVPRNTDVIEFQVAWDDDRTESLFELDVSEIRKASGQLEAMKRRLETIAEPNPEIVWLTQGHRDVAAYSDSIIPGLVNAKRYLASAGVEPQHIANLLDFGCGSGRLLSGWYLDDPGRGLFGCDTNALLIDWARGHLPGTIHFERSSPLPPLPYSDEKFDLICCVSVFTHLRYRSQELWARELARVLRPGGILLLTLHGKPYVNLFARERLEEFEKAGHIEIENAADGGNESASFHGRGIVPALFREFELVKDFPAGRMDGKRVLFPIAALQDVYILRRTG